MGVKEKYEASKLHSMWVFGPAPRTWQRLLQLQDFGAIVSEKGLE